MASADPNGEKNPLLGILLKVGSVTAFVAMATSIKAAGPLPPGQIVFFRSFFAIVPIIVWLAVARQLHGALRTGRPLGHLGRGLVGVAAMGLGFFALTQLPLPEAVALGYAQPPLLVVLGALILGEKVRIYRWSAVLVGLVGVAIISWPRLTLFSSPGGFGNAEALGVAAALSAAFLAAFAMIFTRSLVQTERTPTIVIYFSLVASVAGLLTLPFGWHALTATQAGLLVLGGVLGGIGQIGLTQCYRYAESSTIAPFEYTSLLLAVAIGYLVFADLPTVHTIVGGAIVISSGVFIVWREHRLGLERKRERALAKPKY